MKGLRYAISIVMFLGVGTITLAAERSEFRFKAPITANEESAVPSVLHSLGKSLLKLFAVFQICVSLTTEEQKFLIAFIHSDNQHRQGKPSNGKLLTITTKKELKPSVWKDEREMGLLLI
jgi:hypothetical protein